MDEVSPSSRELRWIAYGERFKQMYEEGTMTDFTLKASDGTVFRAHKTYLSAANIFFETLFHTDMVESKNDEVHMKDMSCSALRLVLSHIYGCDYTIDRSNVNEILGAAVYLQLNTLRQECAEYIYMSITAYKIIQDIELLRFYHLEETMTRVTTYFLKNWQVFVQCDEMFYNVQGEDLLGWLQEDGLNAESELKLYEAIIRWLEHTPCDDHDGSTRWQDWSVKMLTCLRYCLIDTSDLTNIETFLTDKDLPIICDRIQDAISWHQLPMHKQVLSAPDKIRNSRCLIAYGDNEHYYGMLPEQDIEVKFKLKYLPLHLLLCNYSIIVVNDFLVCFGRKGRDEPLIESNAFLFSPYTQKTFKLPAMVDKRMDCGLVMHQNKLIVIGGIKGRRVPDTKIDQYSFEDNEWTTLGDFPEGVKKCTLCSVGESIYVCGGAPAIPFGTIWPNALAYKLWRVDFPTMQVTQLTSNTEPMMNHCLCALNSKLYVLVPPKTDFIVKTGVKSNNLFSYDIASDTWEVVDALHKKPNQELRVSDQMVVTDQNKFYVIGDYLRYNEDDTDVKFNAIVDLNTVSWSKLTNRQGSHVILPPFIIRLPRSVMVHR